MRIAYHVREDPAYSSFSAVPVFIFGLKLSVSHVNILMLAIIFALLVISMIADILKCAHPARQSKADGHKER
jgi:hypothetical protein